MTVAGRLLGWRAVSLLDSAGSRVYVGRREPQLQAPDRQPGFTGTPERREGSAVPTYTPKAGDTTRTWHVIDATDVVLGRLAVAVATLLRGKHKPTFTPNVDGGDFVIIINADKVAISGDKLANKFA
ncbi:MAG: large subunit ribosomal protein, partial [Mycobacterium sp.]|nr:large subunit ribosomal protein [Mycobacterium sp.]